MVLLDQIKNLKIYKQPMLIPSLEDNKKYGSAILLLTPNYVSSKKLITNPLIVNKLRFQSYYMEKDLSYYISGKEVKDKALEESYIREYTEFDLYNYLVEFSAAERNKLKDSEFGVSSERKFPLDSEAHVRSAIKFFNYVSKEHEAELARKIKSKIKEYGIEVNVGKNNRFSKYYSTPKKESTYVDTDDTHSIKIEDDARITALNPFIKYSGYPSDVDIIKDIISAEAYREIIRDVIPDLKDLKQIPIINYIASRDSENTSYVYSDRPDGYTQIDITSPYSDKIDDEYVLNTWRNIYTALLGIKNKSVDDDTYKQADSIMYNRDIEDNTLTEADNAPSKEIFNPALKNNSGNNITASNIASKIKYQTTTKIKRGISLKNKGLTRLYKQMQSKLQKLSTPTTSPSSTPSSAVPTTEGYINEFDVENNPNFMYLGENIITFFNEDKVQDSQLKRTLYNERIRQRSEIIAKLKFVKQDIPIIKYAYPDLDKYNKRNLFVDLYYYNEIFFKNNVWKAKKGYGLYLELLKRLINDPRITSRYKKRTLFIPVSDWNINRSTKMWLYTQAINPISIICELLRTNPKEVHKVFDKIPIVFFGNNCYFKLDFSQLKNDKDSKAWLMKLRLFITKINNKEEFDPMDVETAGSETPEAIKATIVDKIDTSTGVDLSSKSDKSLPISKEENKEFENKVEEEIQSRSDKVDQKKLKEREAELRKLADEIDKIAADSKDSETALNNAMDNSEIKSMLVDLNNEKDDSVKIDAARSARMNKLDEKFRESTIKDKSVNDILENTDQNKPLKKTNIPISSPNKDNWSELTFMNFDKNYDLNADIVKIFYHFTKVSKPYSIRKLTVEDHSTSEDRLDLYKCECEDFRGKRFTIKLDIPRPKDNRYLLRGNEKVIENQFFNMPILKTDEDTCQLISNYQKIFVRRYNSATGKSLPGTGILIKALNKYSGKKITVLKGDNNRICSKYELPIDYIDLASVYDKIIIGNNEFIIYFNQDEIRDLYDIDDTIGVPIGIRTKNNEIIYYEMKDTVPPLADFLQQLIVEESKDDEFVDLLDITKPSRIGTYSQCSILSTKIPLIIVCAYCEGLTKTLDKSKIDYKIVSKGEKIQDQYKNKKVYDVIKFNDGALYYRISYESSLLMNGFKEIETSLYSIGDIDNKALYIEALDDFGGRIKSDGLDNFYDCFVDPITLENLKYYKLPTDFVSIMLYANMLLSDNKYIKHTDTSSRRIRRAELIAAYTYEALALAYGSYANQIKHGRGVAEFTVKQTAVIDAFMESPISGDDSINNALNDVESTNAVSYKGKAGLNNDRSYSIDKRIYDDSMLNLLGMSTGFSGNAGVTRQATLDMNIEGDRGYIKTIDGNTKSMNAAKSLCATEALTPFAATSDDPQRVYMTFAQTSKHMVRTEESDPLLVTNGADEIMPYLCTDKFAFKAKKKGKIKEINNNYMIIAYDDGTKEYVDLNETIRKNSNGGYYIPIKLDADPKLKVGSKVDENTIVAYDRKSFSNSAGESDNLAYDIGKLTKVAIINTDDGYEDSGVCTETLSKQLATRVVKRVAKILSKDANVFAISKLNDQVKVNDPLLIWVDPHDEEEANALVKVLGSKEEVSTLGRKSLVSNVTGRVADIRIYRTCEIDEMSDSLKKIVNAYNAPINKLASKLKSEGIDNKEIPSTYKLEPTGKMKRREDSVLIEFYLEFVDNVGVGDKIVFFSANKGVIRNVIKDQDAPYTDFRPNEKINALVSTVSIDKRMVTSTLRYGALQKLMIETTRSIRDMLGIEYDDSQPY